jgi:hypothetical protein
VTVPSGAAPFPLSMGKGAAAVHSTVIAQVTQDQGAAITCASCGHIYVLSKPLSDQSQPISNLQLARDVWYHQCVNEGNKYREDERRAYRYRR